MSEQKLDHYVPQDRKSVADVRRVVVHMIRDFDNLEERKSFQHGVTPSEIAKYFPKILTLFAAKEGVDKPEKKAYTQKRYPARCRDNVYLGYFGRHEVHGEVHFFPLILDEAGLIDHSKCVNCTQKTQL